MARTFVLAQYKGCPYFDRPELHNDIKQDPTLIPEFMAILETGLTSMKYAEGGKMRSYGVSVASTRTQMTKLKPNHEVGLFLGSYQVDDGGQRMESTRTSVVVVDTAFQEPAVLVQCPKDGWSFWASLPAVFMGCNAELKAAIRQFLIDHSDKVVLYVYVSVSVSVYVSVYVSDVSLCLRVETSVARVARSQPLGTGIKDGEPQEQAAGVGVQAAQPSRNPPQTQQSRRRRPRDAAPQQA
jgi:hypothetical protein